MNARGIPPARGRKMLTPPWLTPPLPAGPDPPPAADWPDPPLTDPPCRLDLTPPGSWLTWPPPLPAGPDPPPGSWPTWPPPRLDLTPPPRLTDLTPPLADWPDPPPHRLTDLTPPPRCGQTNKVKLLPSRRTTYAGGNNKLYTIWLS